jgi:Endomembrane protein 70
VKFSYSVEWYKEELEWKNRHSRYTDSQFFPLSFEIRWLPTVFVLLLTAFLTLIMLRMLKNDFSRYMELDDEALEKEEVRS